MVDVYCEVHYIFRIVLNIVNIQGVRKVRQHLDIFLMDGDINIKQIKHVVQL